MTDIRLSNVRSLKDTGEVPVAPITLLVGENSSGKSTFLRTFPLLKQSIIKKTNGPILWAGDVDDYVDFGSFEETVTNDGSDRIIIGFSFEMNPDQFITNYYWQMSNFLSIDSPLRVKYAFQIEKGEDKEFVSELTVSLNDTAIHLGQLQKKNPAICVDDYAFSFTTKKNDKEETESYRLWRMFSRRNIFGIQLPAIASWVFKVFESFKKGDSNERDRDFVDMAYYKIGEALVFGVTEETIKERLKDKTRGSKGRRGNYSSTCNYIESVLDLLETLSSEDKKCAICALKLFFFYLVYSSIEEYIGTYFSQVYYIAPIRATAERYYRLRNSAIDEVDYQGKNLAIFLNSLPEKRLSEFQEWTDKHFGFKASVSKIEGHLSVEISRITQKGKINLSDTGFGYSQILPIITQLWELSSHRLSQKKGNTSIPFVVAIEQPELHLHPAMQAKLAESFIACLALARENSCSLQLILETHSETIVNYFGRAIAENKLAAEDITVVLFDRSDTNDTITSISNYDQEGFLTNWPVGFFAPEV